MSKAYITNSIYWIYGLMLGTVALLAACLSLPMEVPLGESFWDTYIYIDGAHRLSIGQEIYRDFHAPVGPLNYILFDLLSSVFPHGNVALVIQWCMMLVTMPVALVVSLHALERGTFAAFGLLLPYLAFSILPFNVTSWNAFPGVDGFAYYNRHSSVLLYLLVATLFFVRSRLALVGLVTVLLLSLAFVKINGFAVAGILLAFALVSRRISVSASLAVAAMCLLFVGVLEVLTGSVSAYLQSALRLLDANDGVLLTNLVTTVSAHFDVILVASLLAAYLVYSRWRGGENLLTGFDRAHPRAPTPGQLDQDWLWVGVLAIANTVFEIAEFRRRGLHFCMAAPAGFPAGGRTGEAHAGFTIAGAGRVDHLSDRHQSGPFGGACGCNRAQGHDDRDRAPAIEHAVQCQGPGRGSG
ncbi:hypothetical protein ABWH89_16110 [Hoeflea alexandrii]|uniref:hypothetical protein n=1 Tax=Hoeflea alexandrii TaxID=288436 RepID=UPI0035D02C34